jgi:hypothetical protein
VHITEEHLHHMARRHHATMQKLDVLVERNLTKKERWAATAETLGGAWLGGAMEGKSAGAALGPVPYNLGAGLVLIGASHFAKVGQRWGEDVHNVGNGLVTSWAAASGYAFGKRWKESGSAFGGGGHPWAHPYENGWSPSAPIAPPAAPPAGPPIAPPPAR